MTTFRTRILKCPHCENHMSTYELTSYMVHSSVAYSDGKVDCNPPRMFDKRILICSECKKEFWRDDAFIEYENHNITYDKLPEAMDFHDLPFAFDQDYSIKLATYFSNLLEKGFANTIEREVFLRIEMWQLLNNSNRSNTDKISKKLFNKVRSGVTSEGELENNKDLFESNLGRLISIYEPENDDMLLMLAEMHRELGNFSKALSLLDEIENVDNNIAYKKIKSVTKRHKLKVIKLN